MVDIIKVDISFNQININRYTTRYGFTSTDNSKTINVSRSKVVYGSMYFPYDKLIEKDPITAQILALSSWSFRNTWITLI